MLAEGNQKNCPLLLYINCLKTVLFVLLIFVLEKGYCQKEYNNWYFGVHAGLTFQSGIPVPIMNSAMYTGEGCASISDKQGNLLFYTDGGTVYNKLHAIMTNGTGLLGSFTSTQSALIIQKPGCKSIYYIFTVYYEGHGGLNYSIVDLEKSNGLGEVSIKNSPMFDTVAEKLTAIRHSNGVDIWIIAHEWNNNAFLSYLLTKNGLIIKSVKSHVGEVLSYINIANSNGYLKPSPNGKYLCDALCGLGYMQLFKFDKLAGKVLNPILILDSIPNPPFNYGGIYAIEFSPNSNFLYTSSENHKMVYQYTIINFDSCAIVQSKCLIGISDKYGAMQLGPNGKIYIAQSTNTSLATISNPNLNGIQCMYQNKSFSLNGRISGSGLPNNPFTGPYIQYDGCYTGSFSFHLTDTSSFIQWDFGDPTNPNNTAMGNDPIHFYSQAGTYIIKAVYLTDWNTYDTAISTVWAIPKPSLFLTDTVKSCGKQNVQLLADSIFDHYVWNTGDSVKDITVNEPGWYTVTASDCSCSLADSVFVWSPEIQAPQDVSVCPGIDLVLSANYPGATYLWNTGSVQPILPVTESGLYWVDIQADSCHIRDSCIVIFVPLTLNLGNDTVICDGQSVYLDASGVFDSLVWWDGQTITSRIITDPGTYTAIAYSQGCSMADSITIKICSEIFFPNIITPNDDGKNDVFRPVFKAVEQYHLLVFNRWGRLLFESSDPTTGWDGTHKGSPCPPGTYYFTASYLSQSITSRSTEQMSGAFMLLR